MPISRLITVITLIALSGCQHAVKTSVPAFQNAKDLKIEMSRAGCFGPCPQYEVTIFGNGEIEFCGGNYVEYHGLHKRTISPKKVQKLYDTILKSGFDKMEGEYNENGLHAGTTIVTVSNGGYEKTVPERSPWDEDRREIHRIQKAIDEAASTAQWIGATTDEFPDPAPPPRPSCLKS